MAVVLSNDTAVISTVSSVIVTTHEAEISVPGTVAVIVDVPASKALNACEYASSPVSSPNITCSILSFDIVQINSSGSSVAFSGLTLTVNKIPSPTFTVSFDLFNEIDWIGIVGANTTISQSSDSSPTVTVNVTLPGFNGVIIMSHFSVSISSTSYEITSSSVAVKITSGSSSNGVGVHVTSNASSVPTVAVIYVLSSAIVSTCTWLSSILIVAEDEIVVPFNVTDAVTITDPAVCAIYFLFIVLLVVLGSSTNSPSPLIDHVTGNWISGSSSNPPWLFGLLIVGVTVNSTDSPTLRFLFDVSKDTPITCIGCKTVISHVAEISVSGTVAVMVVVPLFNGVNVFVKLVPSISTSTSSLIAITVLSAIDQFKSVGKSSASIPVGPNTAVKVKSVSGCTLFVWSIVIDEIEGAKTSTSTSVVIFDFGSLISIMVTPGCVPWKTPPKLFVELS